jgi:hypothetical protein
LRSPPSPKYPEQNVLEVWFKHWSAYFASIKPQVQIPVPPPKKATSTNKMYGITMLGMTLESLSFPVTVTNVSALCGWGKRKKN